MSVKARVFIGHGRSKDWLELHTFLTSSLELPCDEFNATSAAGMTIVERLLEMLDTACFAFLVMTAEDEHADGTRHARENVLHETGLFQGRLGFRKAIVLLEQGCTEFSNIHGLVQIHFPPGDIAARWEEIRRVLIREGVLNSETQRGLTPGIVAGSSTKRSEPSLQLAHGVFWDVTGDRIVQGPFCPSCHGDRGKKIPMQEDSVPGVEDMDDLKYGGHIWFCPVCRNNVERNPALHLKAGKTMPPE